MITELLRLGLRLCMVVALFAVAGDLISTVNAPTPAVAAPETSQRALEPLPKPTGLNFSPTPTPTPPPVPKEVVITPTPTHSVVKRTAAPKRKPVHYYSSPSLAKGYARQHVSAYQFACLALLWGRESGWNYHAYNANSGAYGIPQALPGSKMASFGADWRNNYVTQVRWGLNYINTRYGSPCSAWQHEISIGWY